MNHISTVSKTKVALAQDDNGGLGDGLLLGLLDLFNPILTLNFVVSILGAINDFLVRKAGAQ